MKLQGKKINLRKLKASDAGSIAKYANDKAVGRLMRSTFPHPYRLRDAKKFIRKVQRKWKQKKEYRFGIEEPNTEEIIGIIDLKDLDENSRRAELGYWLGKKYWNKGIMTEAVGLILNFAFKKLKLNKVYAKVYHPNKASAKVLERNRFKLEGELRKQTRKAGHWYDLLYYGILREGYKKKK